MKPRPVLHALCLAFVLRLASVSSVIDSAACGADGRSTQRESWVEATLTPIIPPLSLNPLADVPRAMLDNGSCLGGPRQEPHSISIHAGDVFEIEDQVSSVLELDQAIEFGELIARECATEAEDHFSVGSALDS